MNPPTLRDDRGVGLVELVSSMAISAMVVALLVTWAIAGLRSDESHRRSEEALDQLWAARAQMVRELRFADLLMTAGSDAHSITLWIDRPDSGGVGILDTGAGEVVTWRITSDGFLTRVSDQSGAGTAVVATGLVYDADAAATSSHFSYSGSTAVTITLVTDRGEGLDPQTIETSVNLRNA
jgi:hypothetical protein